MDETIHDQPVAVATPPLQRAFLEQKRAEVRTSPAAGATVAWALEKGAEFEIVETVPGEVGNWVKVRALTGEEGFLDGKAKITTAARLMELITVDLTRRLKPKAIVNGMVRIRKIPEARAQELMDAADKAFQAMAASPEGRKALASKNARLMGIGFLWAVGGIIVTAVSYSAASSSPTGGRYIIAWGAVLFGLFDIARGFFGWLKYKD
jgi:hypothetical protein